MNTSPSEPQTTPPPPTEPPVPSTGEGLLYVFTPFLAGTTVMTAVDHAAAHRTIPAVFNLGCATILLVTAWRWSRG